MRPLAGANAICSLWDLLLPLRNGLGVLALCASFGAAGCGSATQDTEPVRWVRVVRDANHTVAIDTGRVSRHWDRSWQVWYRTEHAIPRLHKGKEFNREIVQSRVNCDSFTFKVVSVDMSMNDGPPISVQRANFKDLEDQPWRRVERGTVEEIAAQAACHFAAQRIRAGSPRRSRDQ
jgi:hypothetical protein